jgi:predicted N-acyltransferase
MPVTTTSAHYIPHAGFRDAVADYLERERREVARTGEILGQHGPFRKGDDAVNGSASSDTD